MGARRLDPVRRIATVVAVLGVLGLGAVCCEQVLSIDGAIEVKTTDGAMDAPIDDGGNDVEIEDTGPHCGIPVPEGGCGSCVTAQCCPQMSACAGDPQCRALETCLLACGGDYACRSACVVDNPVGGQTDIPALDTCVAASCRSSCGMTCGQAGSYTTPPDAAPGCEACIANPNQNACAAALACATSLACEISGHCAYACTTPDCRNACASDAGADDLLLAAAYTAGTLCYGKCQIGQNWTCVNDIRWPQAEAGVEQATLTVMDLFKGVPVPGASVAACKAGDDPCASPLSTASTDDAGVAHLPDLGTQVILGFQGHFETTGVGYVPDLYYLSFPLSQPNAALTLYTIAQSDLTSALAEANITPVPGTGTVWVQVEDCLLLPAPNVVVKADGLSPQATLLYYNGNLPSLTATSTDPTGWAFLYNVPPGPLTLHAIPNPTGIESSTAVVHVRAGAMSVVTLLPTLIP
jgi:hypothetical protein